jgi:plasmid stabilization system protein ParE
MVYLGLSRRALLDLSEIETFSMEHWGELVAAQYMQSIEDALNLLLENPKLLKTKQSYSRSLCFYRVRQHFLVCAVFEEGIFVLTVKHGAMDLPNRIAEIEPQLFLEADALHRAFRDKDKVK